MQNKTLILAISLMILLSTNACKYKKILREGGNWFNDKSGNCPCYFFASKGEGSWQYSTLKTNSIKYLDEPSKLAIEKCKSYIVSRAGNSFFNSLEFKWITVTYWDSLDWFVKHRYKFDTTGCGNTKYVLRYRFISTDSLRYQFKVTMDSAYNVISTPEFPSLSNIQDTFKLLPLIDMSDSLKKYFPIRFRNGYSVKLVYSKSTDQFIYEIYAQNSSKYGFEVLMNAMSGEIYKSLRFKKFNFKPIVTPEF